MYYHCNYLARWFTLSVPSTPRVVGSLILEIISNLLSFRDKSFDLYKSTNPRIINLHCNAGMPMKFSIYIFRPHCH